jgi:hypothetical protein
MASKKTQQLAQLRKMDNLQKSNAFSERSLEKVSHGQEANHYREDARNLVLCSLKKFEKKKKKKKSPFSPTRVPSSALHP